MKDSNGNDVPYSVLLEIVPRMSLQELQHFLRQKDSSPQFKRLLQQQIYRLEYDNHSAGQTWGNYGGSTLDTVYEDY